MAHYSCEAINLKIYRIKLHESGNNKMQKHFVSTRHSTHEPFLALFYQTRKRKITPPKKGNVQNIDYSNTNRNMNAIDAMP